MRERFTEVAPDARTSRDRWWHKALVLVAVVEQGGTEACRAGVVRRAVVSAKINRRTQLTRLYIVTINCRGRIVQFKKLQLGRRSVGDARELRSIAHASWRLARVTNRQIAG
eukprot:COSAG05_NODE_14248_length_403_cov_0.845395_1_plen_111_part_01